MIIYWQIIASVFFIGKLPYAPGSWCSFITLIMWYLLPLSFNIQFGIIMILIILGKISSNIVSKQLKDKDPSMIVIDEAVGMCLALFMVPKIWTLYLFSFIIFRIIDIFKPSFIYHIQKLPRGWGIMSDDILSGLITLIIILLIYIYI